MTDRIDSSYLTTVFHQSSFEKVVDQAIESLKLFEAQNPFDCIAFCGMSGSALAYPLSYILKKGLVCVRKPNAIKAHSSYSVEGVISAKSYVIVDDCIDSGDTVKHIRESVDGHYKLAAAKCVGIYLYAPVDWLTNQWLKKRKSMQDEIRIIDRAFVPADQWS